MPAAAGDYSFCYAQPDSVNCLIQQIEFERSQNALATASVARVEASRARELALSLTHCKSRWSRTPRCMAEKAQRFAAQQNQLADASIQRVNRVRTAEAARNAEMAGYIARIKAMRQSQLEIEQNKLIEASLAAVEAQKQIRFASRQNALATASVIRVEIERNRQLALSLSPCKSADDQRPRCLAQRDREFAAAQNAIAIASAARVKAERERAFAAARNGEINASIAAVDRNRAQTIAYNTSHCATNEASPRCEAERNRELQLALTHCKTASDTSPRCAEQLNREFHIARNAEIDHSIAAVAGARARLQANNSITTASVDTPAALSAAEYAALTSHCVRAPQSPRCEAERIREFAAARNAEINASIAAVERNRGYSPANNSIDTGATCKPYNCNVEQADRAPALSAIQYAALTSHCIRVPASPRCAAERIREFAAARNAEIDRSIAAVAAARALNRQQANTATGSNNTDSNSSFSAYGDVIAPLETGALGVLPRPTLPEARPLPEFELRQDISAESCRATGTPFGPLHFSNSLDIDAAMRPELDRLAHLAATCPGMRIEVHGYSDGRSSAFINRSMAQARAQAVADYLITAGVSPNRLATIGRGALAPVLPYSKNIDPAHGRRVEFLIKDPAMDAAARKVMWDLAELLDPTYVPAVAGLSP
ncbi:OmpA family protein [Hyphomicrobium album]|nr:OmpA family protein [Hyphomicrobium album]